MSGICSYLCFCICKKSATSARPSIGIFALVSNTDCFGSEKRLRSCLLKSLKARGKHISKNWAEVRIFSVMNTYFPSFDHMLYLSGVLRVAECLCLGYRAHCAGILGGGIAQLG